VRQWPKISIFAPAGKTMRLDRKMVPPFRVVTTFSISMQSLGEIELRGLAVGAKIGVFFCMSRLVSLHVGDIVQTSIV